MIHKILFIILTVSIIPHSSYAQNRQSPLGDDDYGPIITRCDFKDANCTDKEKEEAEADEKKKRDGKKDKKKPEKEGRSFY